MATKEKEKLLPPTSSKYAIQPGDSGKVFTRSIKDTRLTTVTYSAVIVLMGSLLFGYAIGYSSPVISDLEDSPINSTPAGYLYKKQYQGVFSALMPLGALIGAPLAAWLVDYVGRKNALLYCSIPFATGWLITVLSYIPDEATPVRVLLFAGRFIVGIGVGSTSLCVPLYITEISPTSLRGLYGAANQLCVTIGLFMAEMIGTYIDYYWLAMIPLGITAIFAIFTISLKETPRWLITHGRNLEAGRVLLWLRGSKYDVTSEQKDIEDQVNSEQKLTLSETLKEFKTKPVYHPLILALFLMVFQQFCGINAIIFNAEDTFKGVASSIDPGLLSSLSVGLTQVLATFVGVILTDIIGRRILLISGAIIMCVSISVAGGYEYLDHQKDNNVAAMGIAGIVCYNIGFSIGWGALPWLLTSEIIPLRVRGAGVGIATFVNWSLVAVVTGGYKYYQDGVHPWFAFWSFGLVCLCAAIFTAIFIPETKNRSLEDIERSFEASLHKL